MVDAILPVGRYSFSGYTGVMIDAFLWDLPYFLILATSYLLNAFGQTFLISLTLHVFDLLLNLSPGGRLLDAGSWLGTFAVLVLMGGILLSRDGGSLILIRVVDPPRILSMVRRALLIVAILSVGKIVCSMILLSFTYWVTGSVVRHPVFGWGASGLTNVMFWTISYAQSILVAAPVAAMTASLIFGRVQFTSEKKQHLEDVKQKILDTIEEAMLESKGWKIVENPKTGKFVVMRDTGKEGFGRWKIAKQFDSEEEAKSFVSKEEE